MPHYDQTYPYEALPWYPHMGPNDAHLWNKFVIRNPHAFDSAVYDCRCGEVEEPDPALPDRVKNAWRDLCRGRIDVVAETDGAIYVIEVKPRARGEALGQAINNAYLYQHERNPEKEVIPCVITDVIIPGTRIVAEAKGIKLWTSENFVNS